MPYLHLKTKKENMVVGVELIEIVKAIVLGIVEGITEWLPISSTGHLLLFEHWVGLTMYEDPLVNADFFNLFLVVIQFGSILAIVYLFFKRLNRPIFPYPICDRGDVDHLWDRIY